MLSLDFQNEGKVQAGSESTESIPFTQKQMSLSCDIMSNGMRGSF